MFQEITSYYKRRFIILAVAFAVLSALFGYLAYQLRQVKRTEFDQETERVMEYKNLWIDCVKDIERYVDDSREAICFDTLSEWNEDYFKLSEEADYTAQDLDTCQNALKEWKNKYELLRRESLERVVTEILQKENKESTSKSVFE